VCRANPSGPVCCKTIVERKTSLIFGLQRFTVGVDALGSPLHDWVHSLARLTSAPLPPCKPAPPSGLDGLLRSRRVMFWFRLPRPVGPYHSQPICPLRHLGKFPAKQPGSFLCVPQPPVQRGCCPAASSLNQKFHFGRAPVARQEHNRLLVCNLFSARISTAGAKPPAQANPPCTQSAANSLLVGMERWNRQLESIMETSKCFLSSRLANCIFSRTLS